ncbi:MAG: hydroxymethylglutaryl-CoA reductase, degradative [Bdellovibrio sp.]|nr:hydroxymethylglutaryl-CoA reductase, degradative [Bdellovibrio sp.]
MNLNLPGQIQVEGFSKWNKVEKIEFLAKHLEQNVNLPAQNFSQLIQSFWHSDAEAQKIFDEFSENTITNFYFPYGVVPNFLLNEKLYCVPMVIEESSVVAACSKSAKFWRKRGGFHATIISTEKVGQVHFYWEGNPQKLQSFFADRREELLAFVAPIASSMQARGGGIKSLALLDKTSEDPGLYQLFLTFETCDAMGANFINSILEATAQRWKEMVSDAQEFVGSEKSLTVIMSILSNFTPNCRVRVNVQCPIDQLDDGTLGMTPKEFALKFNKAIKIAELDVYRATTHNKGIFNGIDAVVLATGNDFRAVEACGHAYASESGRYRSLSHCTLSEGLFTFWLEIPMALGTVGGLTGLHPLARVSLDLLHQPSAEKLMQVAASVGLAQNFAALRSLVTTGIQRGHMRMHLMNILNHLEANEEERGLAKEYFADRVVSFKAVRELLASLRNYQ